MPQINLYTKNKTPRLEYVADFIFRLILGIEVNITENLNQFIVSPDFKINYSTEAIQQADIQIVPVGLLSESTIHEQKIEIETWQNNKAFFFTSENEIPFDLLSATFYLLCRYEEYLPYSPDLYQRYPEKNSLACKHHFIHLPLVDLWVMELKRIISSKDAAIQFPEKKMNFIPTYDIDIAYSYLGKGWKRNTGGILRDSLKGNFSAVNERIQVLQGKQKDPFDSFEFLDELHRKYSLTPIYFFLLSQGGPLDKNILPSNPFMKKLIEQTQSNYSIGIHPSYQSNEDRTILSNEIKLLRTHKSRQHYIRFELPKTFRRLIELGITEDYSMGYGSINGFRASTSHPHPWFDLQKNKSTDLTLFPFCFMECNSFFEQKHTTEQAYTELLHYSNSIKQVGGTYITIWHNFSLGVDPMWKGWSEMYETFITEISSS